MKLIVKYMEKYIQTNYFSYLQMGQRYQNLGDRYRNIYSRIRNKHIKRLSNYLAIYTVELVAIMVALQWIEDVRPDRVIICSDSMCAK